MSFTYEVFARLKSGDGSWGSAVTTVTGANPGGRVTITGLSNGVDYEFKIERETPPRRVSDIITARPLLGVDVPPNTFTAFGTAQPLNGGGTATFGTFTRPDGTTATGVLISFDKNNWSSFTVSGPGGVIGSVSRSGTKTITGPISEIVSNKQYFVEVDLSGPITLTVSVEPQGNSPAVPTTITYTP